MAKLCMIYNIASHYREAVFTEIDQHFDCDWYFGENKSDIKEMDTSKLKRVYRYKSIGNPSKIYWQGALIPCLFKKEYQAYFVLAESRSISFILFVILKAIFFRNKKIYGWSHGWYGRENWLLRILTKLKMNCMDGLFVYNNRARNLMIKGGIAPNKIFTIYNSLDYSKQLQLRKSVGISDVYRIHFGNNNPVIVFIGRLTEVKRLDILLEALKRLRESGTHYNLVLIGSGSQESLLKGLADKYNLPVWFYGACYDEKVNAQLIFNADLCVSPGNIGLTAMHSLMFGCPVITHDDFSWQMPEFEAIQKGVTGDFFTKDDVQSLSDTIARWFTINHDREEVRKACYNEIDTNWNPNNQISIIKEHLKV